MYYRLMEHDVLLDFKNRDSKTENFFKKSKMFWLLVVSAITTCVQFGHVQMQKIYYAYNAEGKQAAGREFVALAVI